ncbi:MAG: hypothetical protein QF919_10955 [Nitrospinota bacterium]|jgi:hypothetical protein|nr:hypothetical protein [Nitrospinota bacterium]
MAFGSGGFARAMVRKYRSKILLSLGACFLVFGAVEYSISKFMPIHSFQYQFRPERTSFYPGSINRLVRLNNYDSRFVANNFGYHDRNRTLQKKWKRILIIGDSFIEAPQINNLDDLLSFRLEKLINRGGPGCMGWEVIPVGMSGMGTAQHLILYEKFARDFKPDIVIYVMVYNDMGDNLKKWLKPRYRLDDNDQLVFVPSRRSEYSEWKLFVLGIARRFDIYHGIRTIPYLMRQAGVVREPLKVIRAARLAEGGRQAYLDQIPGPIYWDFYETLLLKWKRTVEKGGAKFLKAIQDSNTINFGDPKASFYRDPTGEKVGSICKKHSIECVSFKEKFRREFFRTGRRGRWRNDSHWDEVGHRLVAEVLNTKLRKLGWLGEGKCGK